MLQREQVNHVARLARLELSDEDLDRMAVELSKVLDHIEKIRELDLDGVEPTSHVVDDSMPTHPALRADEPRESLPREVALAQAPAVSGEGFSVPSPQASATPGSSTSPPRGRRGKSPPASSRRASCSTPTAPVRRLTI